ncbi:DUF4397 domain-containing protein [Priestia flexa]|uniref:DUF4397 domain-containing protein n=1 Tax=Priestia flexa TaxID=86664 RepID=UPI00099BE7D5|nr:DUF4397 domain-containing protein [Priestia flexa]AQX54261.1 peptidase [Priestia flexa]
MKKIKVSITSLMTVLLLAFTGHFASAASNDAMVRVVHASPDVPEVDVYVDGEAAVEGAAFKDATDYLNLSSGEHKVDIYAAGTKGKEEAVVSTNLTVEAGKAYTVAAINKVANLELKVLEDDMNASEGKTKVRVGHFSPDAPAVNVGVANGLTLFENASFKQVTDYTEVDAGTYDLEVTTTDGNTKVLDLTGTNLEANTVYTVLVVNTADSLEPLVLKDNTAMPSEMPKTGMGGASEQSNDSLLPVLTLLGIGAVAIFVVRRHKGYEN